MANALFIKVELYTAVVAALYKAYKGGYAFDILFGKCALSLFASTTQALVDPLTYLNTRMKMLTST